MAHRLYYRLTKVVLLNWTLGCILSLCLLVPHKAAAESLYIQIQKDIGIGHSEDQANIQAVGALKAGSIIAIPARFAPNSDTPDLHRTLSNWLTASTAEGTAPKTFIYKAERTAPFFPIRIIHAAEGSQIGPHETKWLALESLVKAKSATIVKAPAAPTNEVVYAAPRPDQRIAVAKPANEPTESAVACVNCAPEVPGPQATQTSAIGLRAIVSQAAPRTPRSTTTATRSVSRESTTSLPAGRSGMAPMCSNIINSSGRIGEWGEDIARILLSPKYTDSFYQDHALGDFCPKFSQLSPTMKTKAWLWFWAALADEESNCNPKVFHPTHYIEKRTGQRKRLNPRAGWGLWAMEYDANIRRDRGSACREIRTVAGQARCAIDIMHGSQLRHGRSASNKRVTYWGPIIRGEKQLMPHMRRFSACF